MDWGSKSGENARPIDWLTSADTNNDGQPDDWVKFSQAWPHVEGTEAHLMGLGGYFVILSTEYKLGEDSSEFEILYNTKFLGTDADPDPSRKTTSLSAISDTQKCADAFNVVASRFNSLADGSEEVVAAAEVDPSASTATTGTRSTPGLTYDAEIGVVLNNLTGPYKKIIAADYNTMRTTYTSNRARGLSAFNSKSKPTLDSELSRGLQSVKGTGTAVVYLHHDVPKSKAFDVIMKITFVDNGYTINEYYRRP